MKVSIILTNYNYWLYLDECLKSIFIQNYNNIELLIIDDNSNDDSIEIIEKRLLIEKESNIKVIKLYHKENYWLRESCLEWLGKISWDLVMRIDADDYLVWERSVSNKVNLFKKDIDVWFVYSNHFTVNEKSKKMNNFFNYDFGENFIGNWFNKIILWNKIIASGTLVNIKCIKYLNKYIWDWDLWVYISKDFNIWYINEEWVSYRIHSISMSKKVRTEWDKYFKKNQWINTSDQWEYFNDYAFLHGIDTVNDVFNSLDNSIYNKKLKRKALWWCYRFAVIYLLKSNRKVESLKYLFLSFYYDSWYYLKNLNKIFYIIFNIKKI